MDNPMGGIRLGWQSIREGHLKLFGGPAIVQVTFHDFTSQGGHDWHLFVDRERGMCTAPGAKNGRSFPHDALVHATRRYVAPIASPRIEEPGLLAAYQKTILGAALGEAA
jgi:hypothetical protein